MRLTAAVFVFLLSLIDLVFPAAGVARLNVTNVELKLHPDGNAGHAADLARGKVGHAAYDRRSDPAPYAAHGHDRDQPHGQPHDDHAGGSHEDGEDDTVTMAISATILAGIAFQMMMFYIVNYPDEDVEYYAYRTIGFAISLFSALLIFFAANKSLSYYIFHDDHVNLPVAGAHAFFWFVLMNFLGGLLSGAIIVEELEGPMQVTEKSRQERHELHQIWTYQVECEVLGWHVG